MANAHCNLDVKTSLLLLILIVVMLLRILSSISDGPKPGLMIRLFGGLGPEILRRAHA